MLVARVDADSVSLVIITPIADSSMMVPLQIG